MELASLLRLRSRMLGCMIAGIGLVCVAAQVSRAQNQTEAKKPLIVSPTHPKDSRGETVYETQGETQKDVPVVRGVYENPVPLHTPPPKYPKSLKRSLSDEDVSVELVVAENGDPIDAVVLNLPKSDVTENALKAVAGYRFKPATLDGKPIAR